MPDLTIREATIIDGTGSPGFTADVEITDGRISAVGSGGNAPRELDGGGLVLCPGFVDTHTHDDGALLAYPGMEFKLAQGCTSLVIGNCGFSAVPNLPGAGGRGAAGGLLGQAADEFRDLHGYRAAVQQRRPALNYVSLIGHNTMRAAAMGDERRAPTDAELDQMRKWVAEAMEQGACGLSTGLIYNPGRYSATEEVIALAQEVTPYGGLYATHMRNEGDKLLDAVDEALRIGREAGIGVHISHHKAAGRRNWGRVGESLAKVDAANAAEADVTLDVYPYTAGSGRMIEYFNLDRISIELAEVIRLASCPAFPAYEGRMLVDIAEEEGVNLDDLVRRILTAERGDRTICIHFTIDEADIETNLRHPLMMVGSDGIPDLRGQPHPRLYGTMPRVLGEYVRERKVLDLAEAIRRMTSLSCDRFGLLDRGRIEEGAWADLVLFDPATVRDTATYDDPQQEPEGIACVIVNGEVAYEDGVHTGAGAGRMLAYRRESE
jgi:N-acyl-D-amino-acid deacylase